jgi:hypothetical protein
LNDFKRLNLRDRYKNMENLSSFEKTLFSAFFFGIWLKKSNMENAIIPFNHSSLDSTTPINPIDIRTIVFEAVENVKENSKGLIESCAPILNQTVLNQYVEYMADEMLISMNQQRMYNSKNPFK